MRKKILTEFRGAFYEKLNELRSSQSKMSDDETDVVLLLEDFFKCSTLANNDGIDFRFDFVFADDIDKAGKLCRLFLSKGIISYIKPREWKKEDTDISKVDIATRVDCYEGNENNRFSKIIAKFWNEWLANAWSSDTQLITFPLSVNSLVLQEKWKEFETAMLSRLENKLKELIHLDDSLIRRLEKFKAVFLREIDNWIKDHSSYEWSFQLQQEFQIKLSKLLEDPLVELDQEIRRALFNFLDKQLVADNLELREKLYLLENEQERLEIENQRLKQQMQENARIQELTREEHEIHDRQQKIWAEQREALGIFFGKITANVNFFDKLLLSTHSNELFETICRDLQNDVSQFFNILDKINFRDTKSIEPMLNDLVILFYQRLEKMFQTATCGKEILEWQKREIAFYKNISFPSIVIEVLERLSRYGKMGDKYRTLCEIINSFAESFLLFKGKESKKAIEGGFDSFSRFAIRFLISSGNGSFLKSLDELLSQIELGVTAYAEEDLSKIDKIDQRFKTNRPLIDFYLFVHRDLMPQVSPDSCFYSVLKKTERIHKAVEILLQKLSKNHANIDTDSLYILWKLIHWFGNEDQKKRCKVYDEQIKERFLHSGIKRVGHWAENKSCSTQKSSEVDENFSSKVGFNFNTI
jgi:hypothetical protein